MYLRTSLQWWDNRSVRTSREAIEHKRKEFLCVDGWYNRPCIHDLKRELVMSSKAGVGALYVVKDECDKEVVGNGNRQDCTPFMALLKACAQQKDLRKGITLHAEILKRGLLERNPYLGSSLVSMYAKCGALTKAQQLLDELPARNVVSWCALIAGYAQQGQGEEAINCFEQMQREGLSPDAVTFTCVLKACGSIRAADKGKMIHDKIVSQGLLGKNIVLGTAVVDMYAKCGDLAKAHQVLVELPVRDIVTWNALIGGYAKQGQGMKALNCLGQMQREGFSPNAVTCICILKACGSIRAADKGVQIHDEIVNLGLLEKSFVLGAALVDMYAKCGLLAKAEQVLDELPVRDVASWSALITGYVEQEQGEKALNCFERMQREGLCPDTVTFICILKACGSIGSADKGKQIHHEILSRGLLEKSVILGTALVDMYVKCGVLAKAQQVLNELPVRDIVSWSALIAGYAQQEQAEEALNCFERMQGEGLPPDPVTLVCVLKACGSIGAADKGRQIHDEIVSQGLLGKDIVLGTALVDMYAKCGALTKAAQVLDELPVRNVVSWNALIAGYVQHVQAEDALNCFGRMQREGFLPNAVTFTCVLNACSRSGLVDEGQIYLDSMSKSYGIAPGIEHQTCMVDLFGRAGHFDKAIAVIKKMPSSDIHAVWFALLGACQKWGNLKLGKWAFEHAVQVDEADAAAYVCMLNIHAMDGLHNLTQ